MSQKPKAKAPLIQKASGEQEPFSEEKLTLSLSRAGASPDVIQKVIKKVKRELYSGITTEKLYRQAFDLLHREQTSLAARYSLKRAIMSLGPSGLPFQELIAAVLGEDGYDTRTGVTLKGHCVTHEVDVAASRDDRRVLVECKYHNHPGRKCDIKVALYVHARALDLQNNSEEWPFDEFHLATNTKFTTEAVKYGQCVGLRLLSWDYPQGDGLKNRIEEGNLHPITCLSTLKKTYKNSLLEKNVVLCRELVDRPDLLVETGLKDAQIRKVLKEISGLRGME